MKQKFNQHIKENLDFLRNSKLLIAISGGVDSVVLSHLCLREGLNFSMAHCNFNLRGKESDTDETFVINLANFWDVEVFVQRFATKEFASKNKLSTQVAARELRYQWFNDLAEQLEFDYILTAHHLDDNLETFLINLSRGTGLDGLLGIPEINNKIVRPLLNFSREEIEVYGIKQELNWRDDSSNASTKYLRNKLRHDVIPILKNINSNLLQNFQNTQHHLEEIKSIVDDRIDEISEKIISKIDDDRVEFNIEEILKLNNTKSYVYQLLKDYNFTEWNDVFNLLYAQSGKVIYSDEYRLIRDRDVLIVTRKNEDENTGTFIIDSIDGKFKVDSFRIRLEQTDSVVESDTDTIFVDFDELTMPLTIRRKKDGDYFCPIGMKGKKKISKYFKDEKLSMLDKENTWLLCSGDAIVWVIGMRMDERFKITAATTQILKIEKSNDEF